MEKIDKKDSTETTTLSSEELNKVISMYDSKIAEEEVLNAELIAKRNEVAKTITENTFEILNGEYGVKKEAFLNIASGLYTSACGLILDLQTAVTILGVYFYSLLVDYSINPNTELNKNAIRRFNQKSMLSLYGECCDKLANYDQLVSESQEYKRQLEVK